MECQLRRHNETVLGTLEEGDLVEFPRKLFSHWGIYVGMYQYLLFNCRISIFLAFLFTFHYITVTRHWTKREKEDLDTLSEWAKSEVAYTN
jgi:hypothetical protein